MLDFRETLWKQPLDSRGRGLGSKHPTTLATPSPSPNPQRASSDRHRLWRMLLQHLLEVSARIAAGMLCVTAVTCPINLHLPFRVALASVRTSRLLRLGRFASSSSVITLPLLIVLGLPPAIANVTNRLPVLVGMASAVWSFQKSKAIPWRLCLRLLPVFVISALVGAQMAAKLPMERIRVLVHIAGVLALVLLLIKPQRWLRDGYPESTCQNPSLPLLALTAGIGLWTGLIVLYSGTCLLMSLVLVGGLGLQQASAVKAVLIGAATVVTILDLSRCQRPLL